jgi:hypothetical protein
MAFVAYVRGFRNTQALQEWNDMLATTHADVLAMIHAALKFMREAGKRNWQYEFEL